MKHLIKPLKNVLNFVLMIIIITLPLTVVYTNVLQIISTILILNSVKELLKLVQIQLINILIRTVDSVCLALKGMHITKTLNFVKRKQ